MLFLFRQLCLLCFFFFFQAEDGIRDHCVTGVQTCALPISRGGKKVPTPLQRMEAEDLVAAVFPDQLACPENLVGDREIPDHPLVKQTIKDCLLEAMDFPGLKRVRSEERRVGKECSSRW